VAKALHEDMGMICNFLMFVDLEMSSVNHYSTRGLVRRFQGSEGMRKIYIYIYIYMRLARKKADFLTKK
jgi:hypothetical protein